LKPWDSLEKIARFHRESHPDLQNYLEVSNLKRKEVGLRALFSLGKKMDIWPPPDSHFSTLENYNEYIDQLAQKYNCGKREVIIAFDQTQPKEKRIDTYFRKKVQKGSHELNKLEQRRAKLLFTDKLNPEIRMSENQILWPYGDVVILKSKENTAVNFTDERHEAYLQSPIGGEDFYTINLKESNDLIILGPKAVLEPFKAEYGNKIVYIEDLSLEQRKLLKVPKHL
jgi:hypothetical protein